MKARSTFDNESMDAMYWRLNDPKRWTTPQTTIDAIVHCVRERGAAALREAANVERLSRCDEAAHAEIKSRISALRGQP
jgi:hypothetical protein